MKKMFALCLVLLILTTAQVFAAGAAEQAEPVRSEDCFPGELDPRYCDRTGNMVADPPLDPAEWLDPDILVFAFAAVEDPAVYRDVYQDFLDHLENELARPVRWVGLRTYASQVEAMRAGRLHISGFASGSVQDAVNTAGFVPQTAVGTEKGPIGYNMSIIVHEDSGITSIEDLRGRQIAFVSESSNSGFFAPRAILYEEFDMLPGIDYDTAFSGNHDNSILGVWNRDYDAGAIANLVLYRMQDAGRVGDGIVEIYQSPLFPSTAYGVTHQLSPDLQERIKQAFLSYDWEGTLLAEQWAEGARFVEIDYQYGYEVLRTVRSGSAAVAEILGE